MYQRLNQCVFFFVSKNLEKPVPSPFSKLFSRKNKQHDTILILGLKQATSMLSDAPTIISILHPQPARFASKVASWKQNSKIWKSQFLNFYGQSHRKFCPKRKFQPSLLSNIFWSYTLVHTLSNALSTTFMRHLHRAVSAFKPTCKKSNFQTSSFWHFQKTHPTQEEFRHNKIIFDFCNYTFNNNFLDPNQEIS